MEYSQVVRHRFLVPACKGSNPFTPDYEHPIGSVKKELTTTGEAADCSPWARKTKVWLEPTLLREEREQRLRLSSRAASLSSWRATESLPTVGWPTLWSQAGRPSPLVLSPAVPPVWGITLRGTTFIFFLNQYSTFFVCLRDVLYSRMVDQFHYFHSSPIATIFQIWIGVHLDHLLDECAEQPISAYRLTGWDQLSCEMSFRPATGLHVTHIGYLLLKEVLSVPIWPEMETKVVLTHLNPSLLASLPIERVRWRAFLYICNFWDDVEWWNIVGEEERLLESALKAA